MNKTDLRLLPQKLGHSNLFKQGKFARPALCIILCKHQAVLTSSVNIVTGKKLDVDDISSGKRLMPTCVFFSIQKYQKMNK